MKRSAGWLGLAALAVAGCDEQYDVLVRRPPLGSESAGGAGGATGGPELVPFVRHTLAAGKFHSCLLESSELWCWGENDRMALGDHDDAVATSPVSIATETEWVGVTAGWDFGCGLDSEGDVWCWGANDSGQLGVGDVVARPTPGRVLLTGPGRLVSAGEEHACAIVGIGELWCWGSNTERQLGIGGQPPGDPEPRPVRVGIHDDWDWVGAGQAHTCGVRAGELWCWGRNTFGQVGIDSDVSEQFGEPQRVGDGSDWVTVSTGQHHSCGTRTDGSAWCWGSNEFGQLGTGDRDTRWVPTHVSGLADVVDIQADNFNSCSLSRQGDFYCWGWNELGSLATGDLVDRLEPVRLGEPGEWMEIAVGWQHNCARSRQGAVFCVGRNTEGQLGDGTTQMRERLTRVVVPG